MKDQSVLIKKARILTSALADVDCISQRLLTQMVGLHEYMLGESIPQEQSEGDKPKPVGILDYWTSMLQGVYPRLKCIEEHFENLTHSIDKEA